MSFIIETRRSDRHKWERYGEFRNEIEFKRELPNIQALGLYTRRIPLPTVNGNLQPLSERLPRARQ